MEKSTFYKGFSVNDNNITQFIDGCMLLPMGTKVYQIENNKILTYNVESIKICDYNRDGEDNISERNGKYDIEYGLVRYYIPFGTTKQHTSRLTLTHANLNKYLFLSKEELYKSMEE